MESAQAATLASHQIGSCLEREKHHASHPRCLCNGACVTLTAVPATSKASSLSAPHGLSTQRLQHSASGQMASPGSRRGAAFPLPMRQLGLQDQSLCTSCHVLEIVSAVAIDCSRAPMVEQLDPKR